MPERIRRPFPWRTGLVSCVAAVIASPGIASAELAWSLREGLVYEDPSRELVLDLEGRFALDGVHWDERNTRDQPLRVDRALLGLRAQLGRYSSAKLMFDLDGIDTRRNLWEAWAAFSPGPYARVSAGLLPLAFGIEHTLGEGAASLPGLPGFPAFLTGRTDWAARLDGELGEGLLYYDLSAAAGEGFDLLGQARGDPQLSARVTSYPLRFVDWTWDAGPYSFPLVSGLFVNFAYALSSDYDAHLDVATPLRNKLFDTPRLSGGEARFFTFGYGVDFGPIRAFHEITRGGIDDLRLPGGGRQDLDDQITSWQLVVSWRVTGEPYDSRPFRQRGTHRPPAPARPLDGPAGERGLGALELSFRYANADIDRDFFNLGLASFAQSSQEFRQVAAAVQWDPTAWLRLSAAVVRIIADQFPADFASHGRDTSVLLRAELHF